MVATYLKEANLNELFWFACTIWNRPFHNDWNFECIPLGSCLLSHNNTKSPSINYLGLSLLSNNPLTLLWCSIILSTISALSSCSFVRYTILLSNPSLNSPSSITVFNLQVANSSGNGKIAYTSSKGEIPIALFGVVLSTHSASYNFLCQFFWLSETNFFNMLTKFLLLDSACPLPWGK